MTADQGDYIPRKLPQLGNSWPLICCHIITELVFVIQLECFPIGTVSGCVRDEEVPEQVALGEIKVRRNLQMLKMSLWFYMKKKICAHFCHFELRSFFPESEDC